MEKSIVVRFYGPRFAFIINSDKGKEPCSNFFFTPIGPSLHPGIDLYCDGRIDNSRGFAITTHQISNLHRQVKRHCIDSDRRGPPVGFLVRMGASSKVHLRHEPTAKNIAVRIGIGRHRHGPECWHRAGRTTATHGRSSRQRQSTPLWILIAIKQTQ